MKLIYLFGVCILLLQTPLVFSYSCCDVPEEYEELCKEISKSDLSYSEKEELILELEKGDKNQEENKEESSSVGLIIKTDKLKYSDGEEMVVSIYPEDILVKLDYADDTTYSIKTRILKAESPYKKITAHYKEESYEKVIYIKNESRLKLFYALLTIFLFFIILYIVLKKYGRRIWQNVAC